MMKRVKGIEPRLEAMGLVEKICSFLSTVHDWRGMNEKPASPENDSNAAGINASGSGECFISKTEVASRLGMTARTIEHWMQRGIIPPRGGLPLSPRIVSFSLFTFVVSEVELRVVNTVDTIYALINFDSDNAPLNHGRRPTFGTGLRYHKDKVTNLSLKVNRLTETKSGARGGN
jgi:hypothetical protein